jgi:hypothetical protein
MGSLIDAWDGTRLLQPRVIPGVYNLQPLIISPFVRSLSDSVTQGVPTFLSNCLCCFCIPVCLLVFTSLFVQLCDSLLFTRFTRETRSCIETPLSFFPRVFYRVTGTSCTIPRLFVPPKRNRINTTYRTKYVWDNVCIP